MAINKSPLDQKEIINIYFLEMRAKLLDIASFLDRIDRSNDADKVDQDFRIKSFYEAINEMKPENKERTKKIHLLFSDLTPEPMEDARGLKGATGAHKEDKK